ncbi:hypothetical protein F5Y12DRAFT_720605 [Xylaria sp. FL1777]|nr:hypothetical protein F5Y12DRAFT_720605 [Xylaria sp. FL1777]
MAELASAAPTAGEQSTIVQGIIVLTNLSYVVRQWHTILIIWAITFFTATLNITTDRTLAKIEGLIVILHLAGFFVIPVPLVYK